MPLTTIAYREVQTHHAECWRWATHWRCAVARLEEAIELLEQISRGYIAQGNKQDQQASIHAFLRKVKEEDSGVCTLS